MSHRHRLPSTLRLFARFATVGFGNTVLGLAVIFGARQFVSDVAANLIGYLVVVPISFLLHRRVSFGDVGRRWPAFLRYLVVIGIGYLANLGCLTALLSRGVDPYLSQAAAIAVHVLVTFFASRAFVFLSPRHGTT